MGRCPAWARIHCWKVLTVVFVVVQSLPMRTAWSQQLFTLWLMYFRYIVSDNCVFTYILVVQALSCIQSQISNMLPSGVRRAGNPTAVPGSVVTHTWQVQEESHPGMLWRRATCTRGNYWRVLWCVLKPSINTRLPGRDDSHSYSNSGNSRKRRKEGEVYDLPHSTV